MPGWLCGDGRPGYLLEDKMIILVWSIAITLVLLFIKMIPKKRKIEMQIYFGVPGCGKTTLAAYIVTECNRSNIPVYSNVPITGAYKLDIEDIGIYLLQDCHIIIDEAGIDYNNRNYKKMADSTIKFFKYHRHYGASIDIFSQSYEDMDITLRRLCQKYYLVKRSIIPGVTVIKPIKKYIGIDNTTKQIIDQFEFYKWYQFSNKRIVRRKYYKLFNSWSRPQLPEKDFELW